MKKPGNMLVGFVNRNGGYSIAVSNVGGVKTKQNRAPQRRCTCAVLWQDLLELDPRTPGRQDQRALKGPHLKCLAWQFFFFLFLFFCGQETADARREQGPVSP